MSNEFAHFKNKATGEVVRLPAHYETLFPDTLELTEEDVECVSCNVPEPEVEQTVQVEEQPQEQSVEVNLTEPAKRSRRRSNDDA